MDVSIYLWWLRESTDMHPFDKWFTIPVMFIGVPILITLYRRIKKGKHHHKKKPKKKLQKKKVFEDLW